MGAKNLSAARAWGLGPHSLHLLNLWLPGSALEITEFYLLTLQGRKLSPRKTLPCLGPTASEMNCVLPPRGPALFRAIFRQFPRQHSQLSGKLVSPEAQERDGVSMGPRSTVRARSLLPFSSCSRRCVCYLSRNTFGVQHICFLIHYFRCAKLAWATKGK